MELWSSLLIPVAAFLLLLLPIAVFVGHKRKQIRGADNPETRLLDQLARIQSIQESLPAPLKPLELEKVTGELKVASLKRLASETGVSDYLDQVTEAEESLHSLQSLQETHNRDGLDSDADLDSSKRLLKDLYGLVLDAFHDHQIGKEQALQNLKIVNDVMLQISLEIYTRAGEAALAEGDFELAYHYFSTTLARMENKGFADSEILDGFRSKLSYLQAQMSGNELSRNLDEPGEGSPVQDLQPGPQPRDKAGAARQAGNLP